MNKSKILIRLVLLVIACASIISLIFMQLDITAKDEELIRVFEAIREQKLRNSEMSDLLDESHIDDFYERIAQDELGYGRNNEKIYKDISGN